MWDCNRNEIFQRIYLDALISGIEEKAFAQDEREKQYIVYLEEEGLTYLERKAKCVVSHGKAFLFVDA